MPWDSQARGLPLLAASSPGGYRQRAFAHRGRSGRNSAAQHEVGAIIEGLVTGASNRTRPASADEVLSLRIPPLPSMSKQRELDSTLGEAHQAYRRTWALLESTAEEAEAVWGVDVVEAD